MHDRVYFFIAELKSLYPEIFKDKKVLEYGSYNINGSVRPFFDSCNYTGVDWRPGPEVDVISLMHEFDRSADPKRYWDTIVTSSAVEHDPYWIESLGRIMEIMSMGGNLILTCGGPEYEGHCYETSPPHEMSIMKPYYQGITSDEIKEVVLRDADFMEIYDKSDSRDTMLLFKNRIVKV